MRIIVIENDTYNLIPNVMEVAAGKKPYLSIFGNHYKTKDGTGIRDYLHVNNLTQAYIKVFEYVANKKRILILNFGTGKGYSVFEILNMSKKITESKIYYKIKNFRMGDPDKLIASSLLAKNLIDWRYPNSSLGQILESTWSIYKSNK